MKAYSAFWCLVLAELPQCRKCLMPCRIVSLAILWAGAAARITQVQWSSLGLQLCHMLINGPKGPPEKEKQPQPRASPSILFVQKEKCEQTATSYSSEIQTGPSQGFRHGAETFLFRKAVQNERWRQSSSDLALLFQQLTCN